MADSRPTKLVVYGLGAVVAPMLLVSAYLFCSRRFTSDPGALDLVALATAIAVGSVCVFLLPLSIRSRLMLLLGYVPLGALLLFFYAFLFVGVAFGDWL